MNTQMYLKSLALQNGTNPPSFSDPVIVGANMCRKKRIHPSAPTSDGDIWRVGQHRVDDSDAVDIDALMQSVDSILSRAKLLNVEVQMELLQYVE